MKKIVILGSKPKAVLPQGEKIYCANAAFISNEDAVDRFADRVVVASGAVLGNGLTPDANNHEVYKQKLDAVRDAGMSRMILFASPYSVGMTARVQAYLQADERNPDISVISVMERIELVKSVAHSKYPLIDDAFSSQPFLIRLHDRRENWRCFLNWKFGDGRRDVSPKYRPSTGILALLQAIRENGHNAEYVLAGIGTQDRNIAKVKTFTATLQGTLAGDLPQHVHADLMVLKKLVGRYALSTTEKELTEAVPDLSLHK